MRTSQGPATTKGIRRARPCPTRRATTACVATLAFLLLGARGAAGLPCAAADSLWLDVNLPAFRLDVVDGAHVVATYPIAPGAPDYRTPRGRFAISRVEWNPWWIPPDSRWARRERPTAPGPENPMGRVKLHFRPLYFLHGTPYEGSIGTAASHGCVRLRNDDAVALALRVLRAAGSTFDADSLHVTLGGRETRAIDLPREITVVLRYELVEVRGDSLVAYPDIYGLGRPMPADARAALLRAGLDTSGIDDARLRALLARARRKTAAATVDALRSAGLTTLR